MQENGIKMDVDMENIAKIIQNSKGKITKDGDVA